MNHAAPITSSNKRAAAKRVRRAINVSLDAALIEDARTLGVNVSQACETGLEARIKELRRERWLVENQEALEAMNAYVEEYGLPLGHLRQF